LYGELEATSGIKNTGAKPIGRTVDPEGIDLPQDFEHALADSRGKQGLDGVYEPADKTKYDYWSMESKTSGTPGSPQPSDVGDLENPAGNRQLSDRWLTDAAGKSGLDPAQQEAFKKALNAGRVRRIYSTTDPKYGTRYFEVARDGDAEVKIGKEITSEFVKKKP
jgi:hypothetical protein